MALTVLVPDTDAELAHRHLHDVEVATYGPEQELSDPARQASVLVAGHGVTPDDAADLLVGLPDLRYLQTLGAGYEQWSGRLPAGVALLNARGAHGGSTAEWAAAALLALTRGLPGFLQDQAAARWNPHETATLAGTTVLVLGAGDLAANLVARLEPFGVRTVLVGRTAREGVHGRDELPDLLGTCNAVVLMLPLDDATTGMVDEAFLARLPDGAVVVNAGRGPLVRTDALVAELSRGRLRAALDVTDPEPLPADHPLWGCPGLLLTPHVAGSTAGSGERAWAVVARHVDQIRLGQQPDDLVEQG